MVDLTQEGRAEEERRARGGEEREAEREPVWPVPPHHPSLHHRLQPQRPPLSSRLHGAETDDEDPPHHPTNSRGDPPPPSSIPASHLPYSFPHHHAPSPLSPAHHLPPPLPPREQRVSAPTYVPSVEVYEERTGPIQIASQARDHQRHRGAERHREQPRVPALPGDPANQREEGSVICSNGAFGKPRQDDGSRDSRRLGAGSVLGAEPKWKTSSPLASYSAGHMAVLAAQHAHAHSSPSSNSSSSSSHRPPTHSAHSPSPQHGHDEAAAAAQRRYLEPPALYRTSGDRSRGPSGPGSSAGPPPAPPPPDLKEVSAMHSLIKYSGNFAAATESSRHHHASANSDSRGPFGGLGNLVSGGEKERLSAPTTAATALRGPPPPPPPLKREQERPDSSRSFSREGEGEVRHPPVGIAVAVARQRDSGSSGKQGTGPPDPQRSLLQASIKGERVASLFILLFLLVKGGVIWRALPQFGSGIASI